MEPASGNGPIHRVRTCRVWQIDEQQRRAVPSAIEAPARNCGRYRDIDPALRQWIEGLKDKTGQGCCETADGHPAEYEWDTAGNRYKVRIEGEWYVVPAEAVVEGPNKLGFATVWYWWSLDLGEKKAHHI